MTTANGNTRNNHDKVCNMVKQLQELDHPNICRLREAIEDPKKEEITDMMSEEEIKVWVYAL